MLPMSMEIMTKPQPPKKKRKLAAHHPDTLNAHFELACRFIERFPLDGAPFTHEEFDHWGTEVGEVAEVPSQVTAPKSPEWLYRLKQRMDLKQKINFGGMSEHFPAERKFQLIINETGKSCRVISLMSAVENRGETLASKNAKRLDRERREVELMVNAYGLERMEMPQRIYAEQLFRSIRHLESVFNTLSANYNEDLSSLKQSLLAPQQTDFVAALLEDHSEDEGLVN